MDSSPLPTSTSHPRAGVVVRSAPASARRMHPGLLALAVGGFGIGLTEFVIAGLLSSVAADLHVSVPTAGSLIWGYALAVVVGAFTVTAVLSRRPPKTALLVLLILFVIGNSLTAVAPVFGIAVLGRVVTALCHGGFFGIGAVVAGDLVPKERRASAIAVMFGGLTLANVLGVPFGTFIGQQLSWRSAFWVISAIGIVAIVGVATLVPRLPAPPVAVGNQFSVLRRRQVIVSMLMTMSVFGGLFGAFIYVEPLVRNVTGYGQGAVPWLLVLFGIGLFAGNFVGGRAADRNLTITLRTLSVLLPIVLLAYALLAAWRVPVAVLLLVMGVIGFATTPAFQLRVMRFAGDAPTMASAANIAAFNLGNAIGSALGGLTIAAGLGWRSPVWVGVVMALIGTVVVWTNPHQQRAPHKAPSTDQHG